MALFFQVRSLVDKATVVRGPSLFSREKNVSWKAPRGGVGGERGETDERANHRIPKTPRPDTYTWRSTVREILKRERWLMREGPTELTEQSDSACTSVLDYVMKRLRQKAPRIKHKALLVIKNCIEKGHPTFRSELLLRAEEVRAELSCSGPPDPHEGDGPYRKARQEEAGVCCALDVACSGARGGRQGVEHDVR